MLSLDDILAAPRDPELLQRHLQNLGYLSPSEPPAAVPIVPSMTPPEIPPEVKPMKKPEIETSSETGHMPAMKSEELAELPTMMRPSQAPQIPDMTPIAPSFKRPPTMNEEQSTLGGIPGAAPAAEAPTTGSVPFYQQRLDAALAAAQPDKMSDHSSFLGKVGHVLGRVGNTALDVLAPGAAEYIPGTDLYKKDTLQRAEKNLATAKADESKEKLQGAETEEAEARAAKLGEEAGEELVTDGAGNLVGWRDKDQKMHSMQEEGTPQVYKDLAKVWQGKGTSGHENLEQGLASAMQKVFAKGGDPKTDPEVQGWVDAIKNFKPSKDRDVNTTEDLKHRLVVAAESGDIAEAKRLQKLLLATDPEGMARLAATQSDREDKRREREEKEAEDIVRGYDKNGNEFITSKGNARDMNLQHLTKATPKEIDDAKQNYSALNDMGAKARNVKNSAKALDQGAYQKTLIQTALRGHPDDYGTRAAISLMSPQSQEYVQDIFSLREAALALPKQTTGGSRVSEQQAQALWNTIPASGGDSKYGVKQLKKFDENLTRLWKKVPGIEGQTAEHPFAEETNLGGGGAGGGPPREAKPGMKWQQNKRTGEYREVPENH